MPPKPPLGPSRLSQILKNLQREPIPTLPALRSLRLVYASRNDHFGARHFVKEDLPRIAYANPTLKIVLDRKQKEDTLIPEMLLEFNDGSQHKIDMNKKWSNVIFTELLDAHGRRGAHNVEAAGLTGEQSTPTKPPQQTESRRTSSRIVSSSP